MTAQNDQVQIEYMPLSKLVRAPRNPKDHDLGTISESIDRFGFINPILINEGTGLIVAGHGRLDTLQRMKAMGKQPPDRVIAKGREWYVPVIRGVEFANDDEAEAYLIADNRLTETGGWNEAELAQVLSDLSAKGDEMLRGIGFDTDDVDELLRKMNKDSEGGGEEKGEEVEPELPEAEKLLEKWGVQPGDIWHVDGHFFACGDSRNPTTLDNLMEVSEYGQIEGAFTSPPYAEQRAKKNVPNYQGISVDEYVDWFKAVQANIARFLRENGCFFLNIKPNVIDGQRVLYVFDLVTTMVRDWDWLLIDEFSWQRVGVPGMWRNRFKNGFEPIYQFAKQAEIFFEPYGVALPTSGERHVANNLSTGKYYNIDHKTLEWDEALPSNCLPTFGNAIGSYHPAAFPAGLPEFFMKAFSTQGSVWYDPFAGSGTVAYSAEKNGRYSVNVELEPKFVAVSLERMLLVTGVRPERIMNEKEKS